MKYKTRKYLFLGFTLLFFISVAPIILYTQGYRLDTNTLSLKKTGGLDIDVSTTEARIFLNDELERETNFIFRDAIFRNIIPGTYQIRLEKDGYFDWKKTTVVEEGQVTKFPDIRLFPRELGLGTIMRNTEKVFISNNNRFAIIQIPAEEADKEEEEDEEENISSRLIFYDLEARQQSEFLALRRGESVSAVSWSPESDTFSLAIEGGLRGPAFYTAASGQNPELNNHTPFLINSYPIVFNENNIIIPSSSADSLYVFIKNTDNSFSMNHIDLNQRTIRPNLITNILGFKIVRENIFFLDEEGSINRAPVSGENITELTPTAISNPSTTDTEMVVRDDQRALIAINNGSIFLWQENKPLEKIGHSVISASFSPDSQKVLFRNKNNEAVVYWLKDIFGPPQRIAGSTESIKMPGLNGAHWIGASSNHILMHSKNKLVFAELDSRDVRNTASYDISAETELFKVDINSQQIYKLSQDNNLIFLRYDR